MDGTRKSLPWTCRDRRLDLGLRPLVMGILNVTPDSFSDGGKFCDRDEAVGYALQMIDDGADIIDIGGESTRPGAAEASVDEELSRVIPVIEVLRHHREIVISIDTTKAQVAEAALHAGACIVNDVSACTRDESMIKVSRAFSAGVVLMHMQGTPRTMQLEPRYDNVVEDVTTYLEQRVDALIAAGFARSQLAVDPGIGFGKTVEHNLSLLRNLANLRRLQVPIVVGLSRKNFLGEITGRDSGDRLAGSLAGLAWSIARGADVIRVHDVRESRDAIHVVMAIADCSNGRA